MFYTLSSFSFAFGLILSSSLLASVLMSAEANAKSGFGVHKELRVVEKE